MFQTSALDEPCLTRGRRLNSPNIGTLMLLEMSMKLD
jgi:hypothetical protein